MEPVPHHEKISFTAKLVALGRARTTIPFARDVSELIGARDVGADLARAAGMTEAVPPWLTAVVEARYRSLVAAIERSGVEQVLELASGVSLRGLAMALENPRLVYVETDLPELTAEKRRVMEALLARHHLAAPPNLRIAVANALSWDDLAAATAAFVPGKPVAVVNEGLLQYLGHEEKEVVARNVARLLDRHGGVWITPDLNRRADRSWLRDDASDSLGRLVSAIEARTGRSFEAATFATDADLQAFLRRTGFRAEELPQVDGSYTLSSLPVDAGPEVLARLQENLKLWELRRVAGAS